MVMFIMFLIGRVELSYGHTLELNAHSAWARVKVGQRFVCVWFRGWGGQGLQNRVGVVPAGFRTCSESSLLPPYILPAGRGEGLDQG